MGARGAPPINRIEGAKVFFDNIISAMLSVECMIDSILSAMPLIFTLLKVSTKRTAEKACQTRKGVFLRQEQMPNRNNTNAPQNISFRRFCTAVT